MSVSEADSMIELESKEEKSLEAVSVESTTDIDTSYYDELRSRFKRVGLYR